MNLLGLLKKIQIASIIFILILTPNVLYAQENNQTGEHFEVNVSDTITMTDPSQSMIIETELNRQIEVLNDELERSTQLNIILGIGGLVTAFGIFVVGRILSNRQTDQIIRAMVEIENAGYRITKVESGEVAIREDGEIGADLVKVIGGKRIVARKRVSHSTDTFVDEPKKSKSENQN